MKHLKQYTVIGTIFVLVTGSLAHFLYEWSGNNGIVGLFTPINESVWEHMKLLFFPMLIYSAIMIVKFRKEYSCITSALFFGILTGAVLIPILFYAYTFILGANTLILDIGIFMLSIAAAFWLSYRFTLTGKPESYSVILSVCVIILFACFLIFTYYPPDTAIFRDPSSS